MTLRIAYLVLSAVYCAQANSLVLLQKTTVSSTQIVFVYAGDLWSVPREGGDAKRLATGAGLETNAVLSPGGTQMAFTGQYYGNVDLFVMPVAGGTPAIDRDLTTTTKDKRYP